MTVRIAKPSALILADAAEVEVSRLLKDYVQEASISSVDIPGSGPAQSYSQSSQDSSLLSLLSKVPDSPYLADLPLHTAAIALGSNLGDRFANIELALRMLEVPGANLHNGTGPPRVVVCDTSFMYETAPMYVEDQPRFINCACMVCF